MVGPVSIAASALIIASQSLNLGLGLAIGVQSADSVVHSLKYGLALFALYLLLLSLTGLYLRQAGAAGKLGLVGYLVAFLGTMLLAGDWWFETFIVPRLAAVAPDVMTGAITGSMAVGAGATFGLFALGWTLFGVATFRAGIYPRPAAALLIIGGVVGILAGSTPYQIPLAFAVGWIGISLLHRCPRRGDGNSVVPIAWVSGPRARLRAHAGDRRTYRRRLSSAARASMAAATSCTGVFRDPPARPEQLA